VDEFMRQAGLERLDILHADIQGAEVEMLRGARDTLVNHRVAYLFVSTHSQALHHDVCAMLGHYGYRIEISSDHDHETTAHDGLVFATNPDMAPLFDNFRELGGRRLRYHHHPRY
jgi:hypothetical protein